MRIDFRTKRCNFEIEPDFDLEIEEKKINKFLEDTHEWN